MEKNEYQVNSEELERIERFMNSYWKTHEFLFETTRKYNNFLRRKFGSEIVNEFRRITKLVSRGNKEAYYELNDFVFKTGLCDDVPEVSLRGRETLKYLLPYFQTNKPFTLADIGSGDGRIAIGLASYLDKLEKLYAIDISSFAFERMGINMQNLAQEEQEKVRRKIVNLQGEYTSEELQARLFHYEPNGVDVALAAYPLHNFETILPILSRLTKSEGKVITCYPQDVSNMMYTPFAESFIDDTLAMIEETQNEIGKVHGLRFDLNHVLYLPWEMIIVSVGERVR